MPEVSNRKRLPIRLTTVIAGAALLAVLVRRADPSKVVGNVAVMGWGLALIIALAGVSHLLKTWAWELTFSGEKHNLSFLRMFGLRLAAEAGGQLGIFGQVFGDAMRVSLVGQRTPVASAISSVMLDRGLFMLAGLVMTILGIGASLFALPLPHTMRVYGELFCIVLIGFILLTALAVGKRWPVLSGTTRALGRVPYFRGWAEEKFALIHSVENKLLDFHRASPRAFWASFALNLVCHSLAVLEVYLILFLIGSRVSFFGALLVEALTKLLNAVGSFNPGNIGTYEGGNVLIAKLFGFTATAGLTLALARRLRSLFWGVLGAVCTIVFSKSKKEQKAVVNSPTPVDSSVAIIVAVGSNPFMRVGTLPIALRAILGVHKAGAERIIVLVDAVTGPDLRRELMKTRRLPAKVEFLEVGEPASLAGAAERVLLVAGNRTYHPALLRQAMEWSGLGPALALMAGDEPVGIYVVRSEIRCDMRHLVDLHAWVVKNHSVQCMAVDAGLSQRIDTDTDCAAAERKLNRWLIKPTDGLFAQMNRKVSIPISRWIVRYPITPNMVSLFTLGVSFLAGVSYARGGYLHMLLGAVLSLWASILDGCDGEVARLTIRDSAFGCWLETICDYLYYLFLFAGMAIGLQRSSGTDFYVICGGLLLFGAVMSFLATGVSRHRLAGDRPEQLLKIWQTNAEKRRSNLLLYLGRHTEFLVRRSFLPYALLVFALCNLTKVAFVLSAIGANIVWPIALYSCLAFAGSRSSAAVAQPHLPKRGNILAE